MAFDFLLWNCVAPGKTSISEFGIKASLKPYEDECVLAFRIDCDEFRTHFGVRRACDGLFFVKTKNEDPLLVLVELKGSDVGHAVEQLHDTLDGLKRSHIRKPVTYRAVIVTRGGSPKQDKAAIRGFEKRQGISLCLTRDPNLRKSF